MAEEQSNELENPYTSYLNISSVPGGAMKDIAMGLLMLFRGTHPSINARAIVLDTNIILKDLGHICKKNKPSTLFSEAESGFFRLLVTPTVVAEVTEHIPKYAKNTKANEKAMFQAWEIYKQRLVIINPPMKANQKNTKLMERDPDDAPTAYLIEMIQPHLSLSADKDLIDNGYAQRGDWLPFVRNSSNLVKRDVYHIVISVGSVAFVLGISKSISLLFKVLKTLLASIPKEILSIVSIAVISIILDKRSRYWLTQKLNTIASKVEFSKIFAEAKNVLISILEQYSKWDASEKFIKQGNTAALNDAPPATLKGFITRVLAHSSIPLSSSEILVKAKAIGYQPRGQNSKPYINKLLRSDPMFHLDSEGYWSLFKGVKNN